MPEQRKAGLIVPFCFPDLTKKAASDKVDAGKVGFAFHRQFVEVANGSRTDAKKECTQPAWMKNIDISFSDIDGYAEVPEPYRKVIERLVKKNRKLLREVYEKGVDDGKKEGLDQGTAHAKQEGYDLGMADGYRHGNEEGYERGKLEGNALVKPVVASFRQAISACFDLQRQLQIDAQREALKLALVIAKKILARELRLNPDGILGVIQNALAIAESSVLIRLRVPPDFVDYCSNHRDSLHLPDEVNIVGDQAIESGGCVVETESGEIDARIETQLRVLAEALDQGIAMSSAVNMPVSDNEGGGMHGS